MRHVRCGSLFTGRESAALADGTLVVADDGTIAYAGPAAAAPRPGAGEAVLDYSRLFVMPGLIDVHTHLSYGNAKSQEDIDLYQPLEFRALRGLYFAQQLLGAGYTAIASPGDNGQVGIAVRDAIRANLFDGPRITTAGPYLTTRQGLTDWYPTWIGVPSTSNGRLVTSRDEAIEEIRRQVKDGVDWIKLALDGILTRRDGEVVAAFTEDETRVMVEEIHRLGKRAVAHARGREATLYAARAGMDVIFHAFHLDDACIDAILRGGGVVCPTLTLQRNTIDFAQPHDPASIKGRVDQIRREYDIACANLRKAKAAGVTMIPGTDSGFAVTPYGEWHARELEIFVEDLGFTPAEALRSATEVAARFLVDSDSIGTLEPGRLADFVAIDGSPLEDVGILLDKRRIRAVHLAGREMRIPARPYDPRKVSDRALTNWSDLYTYERVAQLQGDRRRPIAAQ